MTLRLTSLAEPLRLIGFSAKMRSNLFNFGIGKGDEWTAISSLTNRDALLRLDQLPKRRRTAAAPEPDIRQSVRRLSRARVAFCYAKSARPTR